MRLLPTCVAVALLAACATPAYPRYSSAPPTRDPEPATLQSLEGTPAYEVILSLSFEEILSDAQLSEYRALDKDTRRVYRSRFWTWNDPTPATPTNEFLEEHVRRLDCALGLFCEEGGLEWDERGEIVLRFGIPDSRVQTIGDVSQAYGSMGISPSSETWTYYGSELTFTFIDANLDGRYALGEDIRHMSARGRPAIPRKGEPSLLLPPEAPAMPRNVEAEHMAYQAASLKEKGLDAIENVPVAYSYAAPLEPLTLFYEIVTFRGTDGATDVAVNYEVPISELSWDESGDRPAAHVDKLIRVTDAAYDVLVEDSRGVSITLEGESARGGRALVADEWRVETPPGEFVVGVAVTDTVTGRTGFGRGRVEVPDYGGPGLLMSDVQVAASVGGGPKFRRMGGAVVPRPSRAFRRSEDLVVYFELYGLEEDVQGISRFTVTTEISGRNYEKDKGWFARLTSFLVPEERHAVSSSILATGDVPDTAHWFAISLDDLAVDNYDLEITVKDVRSQLEVTRTAAFTVMDD
ncbi:MAG: GWxTD domain-containing protein [Candidatus Eisenbacteria bacterium]